MIISQETDTSVEKGFKDPLDFENSTDASVKDVEEFVFKFDIPVGYTNRWKSSEIDKAVGTSGWPDEYIQITHLSAHDGTSIGDLSGFETNQEKILLALKEFDSKGFLKINKAEIIACIEELYTYQKEDDVEELKAYSVSASLQFLINNSDLILPSILATPNGTIVLQWRKDRARNLTVEFLSNNKINYAIFAPSHSGINRTSGTCNQNEFRELINSFRIERWASEYER